MKKQYTILLLILSLILGILNIVNVAYAQVPIKETPAKEKRNYLVGSLGIVTSASSHETKYSEYLNRYRYYYNSNGYYSTNASIEQKGDYQRLALGFYIDVNTRFALELGYNDFGMIKFSYDFMKSDSEDDFTEDNFVDFGRIYHDYRLEAFDLSAVYRYPVNISDADLFIRMGRVNYDLKKIGTNAPHTNDLGPTHAEYSIYGNDNQGDFNLVAFGVEVKNLRFEYAQYHNIINAYIDHSEIDNVYGPIYVFTVGYSQSF